MAGLATTVENETASLAPASTNAFCGCPMNTGYSTSLSVVAVAWAASPSSSSLIGERDIV